MSGRPGDANSFSLEWTDSGRGFLESAEGRHAFSVARDGQHVWVRWANRTYLVPPEAGRSTSDRMAQGTPESHAPLPGVVLSVNVQPGESVTPGTLLLTLEAMKMEHELRASRTLRVRDVLVKSGDKVDSGAPLFEFESEERET